MNASIYFRTNNIILYKLFCFFIPESMKIKNLIFYLFLILILAVSCKKDNNSPQPGPTPPKKADPYLKISMKDINFSHNKDAHLVVINTNVKWKATCTAKWLTFSAMQGDSTTGIIIAASKNKEFKRETTVSVVADTLSKEIQVTQSGVSRIEFKINGVSFTFLPVKADTSFYLDGGTYLASRNVYLDSYFISETEITNAQWKAVTGRLPYGSENNFPHLPVIVNWKSISEDFLPKLNQLSEYTLRLPTENEWEVAARGGLKSNRTLYAGSMYIDTVAWYWNNSGGMKHNVGMKKPNELGLYDMSGNVSEWCGDWYEEWTDDNHPPANAKNPTGPKTGTEKVLRGGDFIAEQFQYDRDGCAVYARNHLPPDIDTKNFLYDGFYHYPGFRLVITKDTSK